MKARILIFVTIFLLGGVSDVFASSIWYQQQEPIDQIVFSSTYCGSYLYRDTRVGSTTSHDILGQWGNTNHGCGEPVVTDGANKYIENELYYYRECGYDNPSFELNSGDCDYYSFYVMNGTTTSFAMERTDTRIVAISPQDASTVATTSNDLTPVTISVDIYVNENDVASPYNVQVYIENIDQNTMFSRLTQLFGVGHTAELFNEYATTSGYINYSTTTNLSVGGYRVHVSLDKKLYVFDIWNLDEQSSQFAVGQQTWLSNIRQNSFNQIQAIIGAKNSTSTEATARTCNPFSGQFDIIDCSYFLFIPDTEELSQSMQSLKDGVLIRIPWGYFTRIYDILSASTTQTLPAFSYTFDSRSPLSGTEIAIDIDDSIAQASAIMADIKTGDDKTVQEVAEPIWNVIVGLALVFTIVTDLMGSHRHESVKHPDQK